MNLLDNELTDKFEQNVNSYLVFLVHAQKSTYIPASDKIDIFNAADELSTEIFTIVQQALKHQNEYNIEEKRERLKQELVRIADKISKEIKRYDKNVKINSDSLFLLRDIFQNLIDTNNDICLSSNSIEHLYSFKDLSKSDDKNNDLYLNKQLENIKNKLDDKLYETKIKTFLQMLSHQNKNAELFYEVNNFIQNKCKEEDIIFITPNMDIEINLGLYFIMNKNDITIIRATDNGYIEYKIRITDLEKNFNINITGCIKVNDSTKVFYIDELYLNDMRNKVLNTYNLVNIINIFNQEYTKSIRKITDKDNANSNSDIDDYLSGKISNT